MDALRVGLDLLLSLRSSVGRSADLVVVVMIKIVVWHMVLHGGQLDELVAMMISKI